MKKILIQSIFVIIGYLLINACNNKQNTENSNQKNDTVAVKSTEEEYVFEKEITVTGTLYELPYENPSGTEMKTHILSLGKSIKVVSKSTEYETQDLVEEIQVAFNEETPDPSIYIDKKITVKGVVYSSQTIHDKRPVVMNDAKVIN